MTRKRSKDAASKISQARPKAGDQSDRSAANGAIAALRQDHQRVERLFKQFEQSDDERQKEKLVDQICGELNLHARLKEELFYPACRDADIDEAKIDKGQVQLDAAKLLINDLLGATGASPYFDAKVSALKEMVTQHARQEEDGLFAEAKDRIDDGDLGRRIAKRKEELQERGADHRPARLVSLRGHGNAERDYVRDERFRGENERGFGARRRYDERTYDSGYERTGRRSAGIEGEWNEGRYGWREPLDRDHAYGPRYVEDDRRLRAPNDDRDEERRYGRGQAEWFRPSTEPSRAPSWYDTMRGGLPRRR